jgi:hypothetical protein
MDAMTSCEELDKIYRPSPEMDKRIRRMISKAENIQKAKSVFVMASKITACLLILLILTSAVLLSVDASRTYIFNAFIKWQDDHSSFKFGQSDLSLKFDKFSINYIPEGFILKDITSDDSMRVIVYVNGNENIVLTEVLAEGSSLSTDNERKDASIIKIVNSEAYLFESKNDKEDSMLIWTFDDVAFELVSNIRTEELIKIAENISKD